MEVNVLRVEAYNTYASIIYQGNKVNKRMPNFAPQDSLYAESLNDESKQLKNVYYDVSEFNPLNFLCTAYISSKAIESAQVQENSINLTPGTTVSLGEYSGQDVVLHVGDSSISMFWGSNPIGSDYSKRITDYINQMINYAVDKYGFPDMSKLTKEQVAQIWKIEKNQQNVIYKLGGPEEYDYLTKIGGAVDCLIRVANGQMPMASLSHDVYEKIKTGLDKMGIDTSRPFYVNGQKFVFSEDGVLRYA